MKTSLHWKKITFGPHHGICVPLSSLRSKNSSGIGEFLDLIPLIDWCKDVGFDCIQLLPINDSGDDPSPYNALSSCALDPVYLSLETSFDATNMSRNEIKHRKLQLLRDSFHSQTDHHTFVEDNSWVEVYGLFKALKDDYKGLHWQDWKETEPTEELFKKKQKEIDFYSYVQFLCFSQMEKVRVHAIRQGIFLKGDIPILLSPDSADVWAHRELFCLDLVAGAPPDAYNRKGQKWGFPLFNWDAMRHSGFAWWKRRLKVAEKLYQIYRIDHVVGFFRIWAISKNKKPTEGHFVPEDVNLWEPQGRELLEMMLKSTTMLPIAEDLGVVPKEVFKVLKEFGICGTKVIRWQKIPFHEYEPFSMTTVSTPDMETLEGWWKKISR